MIFRKSATLQDVTPDIETGPMMGTPGVGQDATPSPGISKKVQLVSRDFQVYFKNVVPIFKIFFLKNISPVNVSSICLWKIKKHGSKKKWRNQ